MAVYEPCYASRQDVKRAPDFKETARDNAKIDRAIQTASRHVEGELHRFFYPYDTTFKWDWPNYQRAWPWRLWFGQWDLVAATAVQSPAGTTIPLGNIFFRPFNRKPGWPCTYLELDRSTNSSFGAGATPQGSILITGTWGFTADADQVATLAAAVATTTATSVTVSDSSQLDAGDLLIVDSERMLVADRAMIQAGTLTLASGATTAKASDATLTFTGTGSLAVDEIILIDSEWMLVVAVAGSTYTVKRAWDGSALAAHSASAVIYAPRSLTVVRGSLGTTAATHLNAAPALKHRVPSLIKEVTVAHALGHVTAGSAAYAATQSSSAAGPATRPGGSDPMAEAYTAYGRKGRKAVI